MKQVLLVAVLAFAAALALHAVPSAGDTCLTVTVTTNPTGPAGPDGCAGNPDQPCVSATATVPPLLGAKAEVGCTP